MGLRKIDVSSRPRQVADQIGRMILRGDLKQNAYLPAERDLSARFGVSRNAVREGVKILQARGLVEIRRGLGTRVTGDPSMPVRQAYADALQGKGDTEGKLLEARIALESKTAELAAERATAADLRAMEAAMASFSEARGDIERATELDIEYHRLIARATQNQLFDLMLEPLSGMLRTYRMKSLRGGDFDAAIRHHRSLLDAIRRRNPSLASRRMREHLQIAYKEMLARKGR